MAAFANEIVILKSSFNNSAMTGCTTITFSSDIPVLYEMAGVRIISLAPLSRCKKVVDD